MAPSIECEETLEQQLAFLIHLSNHLIKAAVEADSFCAECDDMARQATDLSHMLRLTFRLTLTLSAVYHRPIRRIAAETIENLQRAVALVRKCKHSGIIRHFLFTITSSASEFKKVSELLESSIADFRWLLSVFSDDGENFVIPPIARNDPIIAWVWSLTALLQFNRDSSNRIEAANYLASLARSNHRYRNVIVEEGAVKPLLQLLRDGGGCSEGQVAAATALYWLAENDVERCRTIRADNNNQGITNIVKVLGECPINVQIAVTDLVTKIVEVDDVAREEFGRNNVMQLLISCLMDDYGGIVQTAKNTNYDSKHKLKTKCASALWRLCDKSLFNCQKIVDPKSLFCLSKIIEMDKGELRLNCLMTIMEVAQVAEGNVEFRKAVWKPSTPSVKSVLDQLRTVIKNESSPEFQIPAIRAIGCLARIYPAKEIRVVGALVPKLGDVNMSVATESVIALTKFTCPDNHNCVEHSRMLIEFNGVPLLMNLLSVSEGAKLNGVVLLCYLCMHAGNSKALAEARAMITLESAVCSEMSQNIYLREIITRAMNRLVLYQD